MPIIVYNRKNDDYSHYENNYPCYRGGSVLANPYTHLPLKKTKALYKTRTKEEAIELGLQELGVSIGDVDVRVLEEGSKGLFGLFGSRPAKVLLTVKPLWANCPSASSNEPNDITFPLC